MFCLYAQVELTHLSACRDALWGLDTYGRVSIRTLSPSCPTGLHWTPLDLSQLGMYLDYITHGNRTLSAHKQLGFQISCDWCRGQKAKRAMATIAQQAVIFHPLSLDVWDGQPVVSLQLYPSSWQKFKFFSLSYL